MIALPESFPVRSVEDLHTVFLKVLPRIETHARIFFRDVRCPQERDERVAETIALAWKWFVRLAARGKDMSTFVTRFIALAALGVRCGRRLCGQEPARDVMSDLAQRRHRFVVGKLPDYDTLEGNALTEALHDNTRTPPPDAAAFRCDFPEWLFALPERDRQLAIDMARSETTKHLAAKYGLSTARVSQLRREFKEGWTEFCDNQTSSSK